MIKRKIYNNILNTSRKTGKIIIITGSRQVGKTTLLQTLMEDINEPAEYLNCDEPDIREYLSNKTSTELRNFLGKDKYVFIDEAQRVENIGITLKLIYDNFKDIKLIVTGSSAINLGSSIKESLAGRFIEFHLYPFSFSELASENGILSERRLLEHRLIFGSYPDITNNPGNEQILLKNLTDSYLFKDILSFNLLRKPEMLSKLLTALAYKTGSEVSYNELSNLLDLDNETVETYIDLLEKSFVIFRLSSFSRNLRNEIKKKKKIYFRDNGIRNSVINDFKSLEFRNDKGALFENYIITEKIKHNHYNNIFTNYYFWKNSYKQEIDLIEERESKLFATEIKFNPNKKVKLPNQFADAYTNSEFNVINSNNYSDFLT